MTPDGKDLDLLHDLIAKQVVVAEEGRRVVADVELRAVGQDRDVVRSRLEAQGESDLLPAKSIPKTRIRTSRLA